MSKSVRDVSLCHFVFTDGESACRKSLTNFIKLYRVHLIMEGNQTSTKSPFDRDYDHPFVGKRLFYDSILKVIDRPSFQLILYTHYGVNV